MNFNKNNKTKKMETSKKILWLSYGVTGFLWGDIL